MKPTLQAALLLVLSSVATAFAQAPALTRLQPAGIQPGKPTDVVLLGGNLAGPTGIWSDLPLSAELTPGLEGNGTQPASVSYRLTVPAETPPGIAGFRVATGGGVSNLRLILVDDLPAVADNGNNKTPQTAQAVSLPTAIDGVGDGEASDFYKFSAAAGQRVSVEVFARRLGSPLDPMIRLVTTDGRELAFSDDERATGADGHFSHTFAEAGDYLIEIRDVRYQGGGNFFYRLRVGDLPLVSAAYPLAVQKGTSAAVTLAGPDAALASPVTVNMPAEVPGDRLRVAATGNGQGSGWVTLMASDKAEQLEAEPNDSPEQATKVTTAGAINGRFEAAGDDDYYQFDAKKGERLVFTGQARSLGSPCDLFLRLYNAEGGAVATAEDEGTQEGSINFTFPADGTYRLRVEETNRRGGPDMIYRIAIQPYQPGFDLAAEVEKVDAPQSGVFVVKVTAARRDYNGPITLGVEGAGEGCTLGGNVIPEGKPETTMSVTVGSNLKSGHLGTLSIFGTAKVGEADFRAEASTLVAMRNSLSALPYPPHVLDGTLGLGIGPVFPQFFQVASASPVVSLLKAGATASLPVNVTRSNGFEDGIALAAEGLPAGVTIKPLTIEKGKADGALELTSAGPLPPGTYPFKLVGNATFQHQPQQFAVEGLSISGPPVSIAFAPAGAVPVGGKQKGTLTFAGDVAPIAPAANYQGGVTRGVEGPRAAALPGFEADNRAAGFSGLDKGPGDDRLTAELPTPAQGDYSVEFWVYNTRDLSQPNAPAVSGYLYSRPGTASATNAQPGDHLGIGGVESSPRDMLFFYDGQSLVAGHTPLAINAWHHVVLVRSGDQVRVYLDGNVANPEIQATVPKRFDQNQIVLGTRADGYGPFQGRLDEAAFFDAVLSPEQVAAHFAAAKGMTPARDVVIKDNPLAYWRLDETEGALAATSAPAHKRLVTLAWQNLPAGISVPREILLVDAQAAIEVELAAGADVPAGKVENVVVTGTTPAGAAPFTAESVPVAVEVTKP